MKRKLYFLVLVFVTTAVAFAQQITISSLIVKPVLPANVSQWNATAVNGIATGTLDMDGVKMAINIVRNGNFFVCGTTYQTAQEMPGFATKVIRTSDVTAALGDCILPPGEYRLCIQFYSVGLPDAYETCRDFSVASPTTPQPGNVTYTAPTLLIPADGTVFIPSGYVAPLTFRWTPVIPQPPIGDLIYTLRIYEIGPGQQATQALIGNSPIYEKQVKTTQASWKAPIEYAVSSQSTSFVWNVQATNNEGQGYGPNNGLSGPFKFTLKSASSSQGTTVTPTATTTTAPVLPGNAGTNNTTSTTCTSVSATAFKTNDIIHLSDGFDMKLIADPTGDNEHLTGIGTVAVKWLGLMNVQFKEIKVNSGNYLCAGAVYTVSDPNQAYPTQWAVNVLNNNTYGAWTIAKVKLATNFIKTHKITKPLVSAANQVNGVIAANPVNMPLGYFKNQDQENLLGFTEMVFRPEIGRAHV